MHRLKVKVAPATGQHIEQRCLSAVSMSGALGARSVLVEASRPKSVVNTAKRPWLGSQVEDDVNIVRWSHVESLSLNLVEEDHLTSHEQPVGLSALRI